MKGPRLSRAPPAPTESKGELAGMPEKCSTPTGARGRAKQAEGCWRRMEVACEGPASQQHCLPPSLAFLSHSCPPLLVPGSAGRPGNTHTRTDLQRARSHVASTWRARHSLSPSPTCIAIAGKAGPSHCHRLLSDSRGSSLLWPWSLLSLPKTSLLPSGSHSSLNELCFEDVVGGKQVNQGWSLLSGSPPGLRGPQGSHRASGSLRLASGRHAHHDYIRVPSWKKRNKALRWRLRERVGQTGGRGSPATADDFTLCLQTSPTQLVTHTEMAIGHFSQGGHSPLPPPGPQVMVKSPDGRVPYSMGKAGPPGPEG
ncbi:uncharacterized protein LOC118000660 [Mirounga leonina]|uniref:uncharacterized protein LOC118000660 n=1 Tax=Mirounga leonina TaxID=9715 RepID=UPI00156C2101|nr:uncharacterized protein LOC118000660 [Mirounga leonina]